MTTYEVRIEFPDGHKETRLIDAVSAEWAEWLSVKDEPDAIPHAYPTGDDPARQ
jgi:hypothetical protein